jgi:hypothetical protein
MTQENPASPDASKPSSPAGANPQPGATPSGTTAPVGNPVPGKAPVAGNPPPKAPAGGNPAPNAPVAGNPAAGKTSPPAKTPAAKTPPAAAKKKKRKWPRVLAGLGVVVILFLGLVVYFLPNIASTGVARDFVVSKINANLVNGAHIDIKDWTIGWHNIDVVGISIIDANNAHVLDIAHVSTSLSLMDAVRGNYNLGHVPITKGTDFNLTVGADGKLNLAALFKPSTSTSDQPSKLPNISGVIEIQDATGTLTYAAGVKSPVMVDVDDMNATITITDINEPITEHVDIKGRAMNSTPTTLVLDGTIGAIQNNLVVDTQHMNLNQTLSLNGGPVSESLTANMNNGQITGSEALNLQSDAAKGSLSADVSLDLNGAFAMPKYDVNFVIDPTKAQADYGSYLAMVVAKPAAGEEPGLLQRLADNSIKFATGQITVAGKGQLDANGFKQDVPLKILMTPSDVVVADSMGGVSTAHVPAVSITLAGSGKAGTDHRVEVKDLAVNASVGADADALLTAQFTGDAIVATTSDSTASGAPVLALPKFALNCTGDPARMQAVLGPLMEALTPSVTIVPGTAAPAPSPAQLLAQNILVVNSGKFTLAMAGSFDGVHLIPTGTYTIIDLKIEQQGGQVVLAEPSITGKVGGEVDMPAFSVRDIPNLNVSLIVGDAKAPTVSLAVNGNLALKPVPSTDAAGKPITGLTLTSAVCHVQKCQIDSQKASAEFGPLIALLTPANATAGGTSVASPAGTPAAPAVASSSSTPAEPPLQITNGMINVTGDVGFKAGGTSSADLKTTFAGLTIKRGANTYTWKNAVTANFLASADQIAGSPAGASIVQQIGMITVTSLSADVGFAKVALADNQPISATGLDSPVNMAVTGGIVLDGDIAEAERAAEIVLGDPANTYPYQGHFHFSQSIAKSSGNSVMKLPSAGAITNFKMVSATPAAGGATSGGVSGSGGATGIITQIAGAAGVGGAQPAAAPAAAPQPTLTESEIDFSSPVTFDWSTDTLTADGSQPVSLTMKSTQALSVSFVGVISDLFHQRNFKNCTITATYDLQKDLAVAWPFLPDSFKAKFPDLTMAGKRTDVFAISGSYPAGVPFAQAIASLEIYGGIQIDNLSTDGITIQNMPVPIWLKNGVARLVYHDLPEGKNAPEPASCNGGLLDPGIMALDLTKDPMILDMPGVDPRHPHQIFKNISMNSAISKTVVSDFLNNPAFSGAQTSQGTFDLSVLQCKQVPLGALLTENSKQNGGVAEVQYSIQGLQAGSTFFSILFKGNNAVPLDINNADVKLQDGLLTQDTTMMVDKTKPIHMTGGVELQSKQFQSMQMSIPLSLAGNLIPSNLLGANAQLVVPVEGTVSSPQFKFDQAVQQFIKDNAAGLILNNVLGGNKNRPGPASQPSQEQNQGNDPLQNLLNGLTNPGGR